jgi:arylsulfatase A-like enzyme
MYQGKCPDKSAAFLGMVTNIDDNMGLLMKKLNEWDLADDTLLIFMTDNGSSAGSRVYNYGMKAGKGSANEGGSRVPLFFRLPGKIAAGADVDRLARHYDMFPTLAEFAGAKIPKGYKIDGRSLVPLIENPKADWKDRYTFSIEAGGAKKVHRETGEKGIPTLITQSIRLLPYEARSGGLSAKMNSTTSKPIRARKRT